jgi:hypothetical protein
MKFIAALGGGAVELGAVRLKAWSAGGIMSRPVIMQFVAGLLLGSVFLWVLGEYGWESPRTIWAAFVLLAVVLAVNLGELRARVTRLEGRATDRK